MNAILCGNTKFYALAERRAGSYILFDFHINVSNSLLIARVVIHIDQIKPLDLGGTTGRPVISLYVAVISFRNVVCKQHHVPHGDLPKRSSCRIEIGPGIEIFTQMLDLNRDSV